MRVTMCGVYTPLEVKIAVAIPPIPSRQTYWTKLGHGARDCTYLSSCSFSHRHNRLDCIGASLAEIRSNWACHGAGTRSRKGQGSVGSGRLLPARNV